MNTTETESNDDFAGRLNDLFTKARSEPTVDITDVSHTFGEGEGSKQVLIKNNLKLYPGEIVIMTGPSGSGKTTLLTLIGALRSLQEGSLKILGKELNGLNAADQVLVRRNIGFIFQAHNLFDSLSAYQNVRLATELHDYTEEQRRNLPVDILTDLGLAERLHYKPGKLSGGQRQRVAIGRALVNKPKLILADEPTAALDKESGRQVVNLLKNLAHNMGATVMIVTHDNRILDVADRIVNMVDGHVMSNVAVAEKEAICNLMRKCSVFKDFSPALLADVAEHTKLEKIDKNSNVITQGASGENFYITISGSLGVEIEEGGAKTHVRNLNPGDFFGELALLHDRPRSATVFTREDSLLMSLSKEKFLQALNESHTFEQQLKKVYFTR